MRITFRLLSLTIDTDQPESEQFAGDVTTTMHEAGEVETSLGFDPPGYYAKGEK